MMVMIAFIFVFKICRHVFYVVFFYGDEVYFSIFLESICYCLSYDIFYYFSLCDFFAIIGCIG